MKSMRTLLVAAALALTAGSALPAAAVTTQGGRASIAPGDENCSVTVVFGSYAMGIDQQSFQKVERYLKRRAPAVRYTATSWGREGEKTVCVTTRSAKSARRVFNDIRNLLPQWSQRGPVELRSNQGQAYQTRNPAERPRRG